MNRIVTLMSMERQWHFSVSVLSCAGVGITDQGYGAYRHCQTVPDSTGYRDQHLGGQPGKHKHTHIHALRITQPSDDLVSYINHHAFHTRNCIARYTSSRIQYPLGMTTTHAPEDQPFDHETVVRHGRSESSTNLLHHDSNEGIKDGGYDPAYAEASYGYGPSEYNLNDKPNAASYPYGGAQPYSDMGEPFFAVSRTNTSSLSSRTSAEIIEPYDPGHSQAMLDKPTSSVARALGFSRRTLAQRIDDKKRGIGIQRRPYAGTFEYIEIHC